MGRILAVDPGEARIGIAISDPTGTVARPLPVIRHASRQSDAAAIRDLAEGNQASLILVGLPLDADGRIGPQARRSLRLVETLRAICGLPIETWDESGTTRRARQLRPPGEPEDSVAAAFLLQDFIDSRTGWDQAGPPEPDQAP